MKDPFVAGYHPSELKIAAEFLTTWFPYLTQDLCHTCTQSISNRIFSLDPELERIQLKEKDKEKEEEKEGSCDCDYDSDSNSLGSWKDSGNGGWSEHTSEVSTSYGQVSTPPSVRISWADMAQQEEEEEDELEEEEEEEEERGGRGHHGLVEEEEIGRKVVKKNSTTLSREQREYLRFKNVERKKDFICLERFKGKHVNILEGLELHTGVFSAAEQTRIVDYIYRLQEKGRRGELRERTFSAPQKWMRGKGRETIQFGCCYNYAVLKDGNPPGILRNEQVDPIPPLLKVIIRRLVGWHVLPPTCVPDSCIINIYEEGDCIPPHIDHHDFVRPFCTVSFLSECHILFGTNLKILGPGDFSGTVAIPLPVGSVLVLNGNGADVAKHCVPAVPTKRISITFRKMDETKRPLGFVPEPDLQGLQPLPYDIDDSNNTTPTKSQFQERRSREFDPGRGRGFSGRGNRSEPRYSGRPRSQSGTRRTVRMSLGT